MRLAVLLFCLSFLVPQAVEAQLFRRLAPNRQAQVCQGPVCYPSTTVTPIQGVKPLIIQSSVCPDDLENFEPVSEVNAQWARSASRMIAGNSCGSGSVCGFLGDDTLVITNAHVVGTRPGTAATVRMRIDGQDRQYTGHIVMAAYSSRFLADWAIVKVAGRIPVEPRLLATTKPVGNHVTVGSPRCVWPLVYSALRTVDASNNSALWRWTPNAIGGQSGSGVWSPTDGHQYGLITWSWGGYGAGQQTWWIYQQAQQRSADVGELRPAGLIELAPNRDVIVEEGFFSQSNIGDLPIWAGQTPPVDPPTDPECPPIDEPTRAKLREAIQLLQAILSQTAA